MREVVRGSRVDEVAAGRAARASESDRRPTSPTSPTSPTAERITRLGEQETSQQARPSVDRPHTSTTADQHTDSTTNLNLNAPEVPVASRSLSPPRRQVAFRADSNDPPEHPPPLSRDRRRSSSFFRNNSEDRPEAEAYYDSRAATKREWRRRATTLEDYYHQNPELLPQLPFTWHRGKKRWRLILLIAFMWIDACVVPIALYYGLWYGGDVQGWIIFAVVTTIWGGPTYLEFALRTFKLMKKERFYRPLGTNRRWCFDYLTWVTTASITVVTALFVIGSAPHIVWLRVLCMPMPALLYCLGFFAAFPTLYHYMGWKAPFRISSTAKGEIPKPGVYYFCEDTVAVNANAGRPYREALAARYDASPRFRRMFFIQSIFWSIPPIIIAIPLTVVAVVHSVPATAAYGICWAIPFIWATIWGFASMIWCKRDLVRERVEWETTNGPIKINEVGLDAEDQSPSPPTGEKKDTTQEQTV